VCVYIQPDDDNEAEAEAEEDEGEEEEEEEEEQDEGEKKGKPKGKGKEKGSDKKGGRGRWGKSWKELRAGIDMKELQADWHAAKKAEKVLSLPALLVQKYEY
jgi:hypothetical protein